MPLFLNKYIRATPQTDNNSSEQISSSHSSYCEMPPEKVSQDAGHTPVYDGRNEQRLFVVSSQESGLAKDDMIEKCGETEDSQVLGPDKPVAQRMADMVQVQDPGPYSRK